MKLANLPPTVVLVGASVRAAAESARRGGFAVIGMDLFGDLDTLAACKQHFLLDQSAVAGPLVSVQGDAPMLLVGGLGASIIPNNTALLGPTPATIAELKSHTVLGEIARKCGLNVPETISRDDFLTFVSPRSDRRWLRKSLCSSGGLGVTWNDLDTIPALQDGDPTDDWVLQRWIAGRTYGASLFVDHDRTVLLGVLRSLFVRRGSRPFTYAGSFGPVDAVMPASIRSTTTNTASELFVQITRLGDLIAKRFGLRGLFNVDLVIDNAGKGWVLEVNPRWTAASEIVERHLSQMGILMGNDSLMRRHIMAHLSSTRSPWLPGNFSDHPSPSNWIKRVLYADRPGTLDINRLNEIQDQQRIEFLDLPPSTRVHMRGDPVLTMIGRLNSLDVGCTNADPYVSLSPRQWRRAIQQTLELIEPAEL